LSLDFLAPLEILAAVRRLHCDGHVQRQALALLYNLVLLLGLASRTNFTRRHAIVCALKLTL
jgi:hypothetical protein